MIRRTKKYNPGFLTDQELLDSYCVREAELDLLVETIRDSTGNSNPHSMVIAPRGFGKTTLLLRVALEVRIDPQLSASWLPVVFPEESYEVSTCGEFWLQCVWSLAGQAPREFRSEFSQAHQELRSESDDRMLAARCLSALLDFSTEHGKRLVLFVENLNRIFDDIRDPDAGWQLRKTLQCEPRILVIGSATSRFDEIDNPERALYELFSVHPLKRLDTRSCAVLWRSVARQEIGERQVRSLEILTGGSPRLLVIVAGFGFRLSFTELLEDLLDLVDDHTEYFRSHLEALGPQERRVYLAVATLWKPATAREVSAQARLPTSHCSSLLRRLINRGGVISTGGTPRRRQYYLAERMYNLYYLLRRGGGRHRVVDALVHFIGAFYSGRQLRRIQDRIQTERAAAEGSGLGDLEHALALLCRRTSLGSADSSPKVATGDVLAGEGTILSVGHDREVLRLAKKARRLVQQGELGQALVVPEKILSLDPPSDPVEATWREALAHHLKSVVLARLGRLDDSLDACDEFLGGFGKSDSPALGSIVARVHANKIALLEELERPAELVAACDAFVRRFGSSTVLAPEQQRSRVLCVKGDALVRLKLHGAAQEAFSSVIDEFGPSLANGTNEPVVRAYLGRARLSEESREVDKALSDYQAVIDRFETCDEEAVATTVADALLGKVGLLLGQGRFEEALRCSQGMAHWCEERSHPTASQDLASALLNSGVLLDLLGQHEKAETAFTEVITRFSSHESEAVREQVVRAHLGRSVQMMRSDQPDDGVALAESFVGKFGKNESPRVRRLVGLALLELAKAQLRNGQLVAAIASGGRVLAEPTSYGPDSVALARLLRAEGYFHRQDQGACANELAGMLEVVPETAGIGQLTVEGLMGFTLRYGPMWVLRLIENSSAMERFLPVAVALKRELGVETRVSREVGEVARDIQAGLAEWREEESDPSPA